MRLADGESGSIVHRDVLNGRKGIKAAKADVAHVADVEDAHAGAHSIMLGDDAAGRGILDRHVPAIEFDHLRAHRTMNGIKCGLADSRCDRLD